MSIQSCDVWKNTMGQMSSIISPYCKDYIFYMYMISQTKVRYTTEVPTAAVSFRYDHYDLLINEEFFKDLTVEERLGVLKHEMLHILHGHLTLQFKEDRHPTGWNYATDCAINQMITPEHLIQGAIIPETFPIKTKCPKDKTAEQYYEMLDLDDLPPPPPGMDEHSKWSDMQGDEQIAKDIAKSMAEKSADATMNSKNPGNLPSEYSQWIENLSTKREVNWKRVLKGIVGNKKSRTRKTILRRDRRNPNFEHIKGKQKDRTFTLAVVSDVSGSVSDQALQDLWGEIINITKSVGVTPTLVQVDTEAHEPVELKHSTKKLERQASGGTHLSPAIEKLKDCGIEYDAMVVTTDGYLFSDEVEAFRDIRKRLLWLINPDGQIMEGMNDGRMTAIQLKG